MADCLPKISHGCNRPNLVWQSKTNKQFNPFGQVQQLSKENRPSTAQLPIQQMWRIKSDQMQDQDTRMLPIEGVVLGSNSSSFSVVRGMNVRVLPFRNLLAFFRAYIYKAMPPMILNGKAQEIDAQMFCKQLQYTFVAGLLKKFYSPIIGGASPQGVNVDKMSWEVAFAPLVITMDTDQGNQSREHGQTDWEAEMMTEEAAHIAPATCNMGLSARKEKKKKAAVEVDPSNLRRSTRANKYDRFKAPSMAEGRAYKSKVKPRQIPTAPIQITTTSAVHRQVPPPTPIPTLQIIGSVRCGIPADELSQAKLLASKIGESSSST